VNHIIDLLEFVLANLPFPWAWITVVGILVVVVVFFVLRYRWNYKGERGTELFLSKPSLFVFFAGVLAWSCFSYWYINDFGLPDPFPGDQIGILISLIPGDSSNTHQQTYAQAIRAAVKGLPDLENGVSVKLIQRPLSSDPEEQQKQALDLGHRLHATFVLRAIPVEGGDEVWLTVVNQEDFPKPEAYSAKVTNAQLSNLDRLELPKDVALLASCAVALLQYEKDNYAETIALLTQVLRSSSLPDGSPSRAYLHFYLGNSYTLSIRDGEPLESLARAMDEYSASMNDWTRDHAPLLWASAMANRAAALMSGPMDESRVQDAIGSMALAEEVFRAKHVEFCLGILHANRSFAYRLKLTPDRNANLEMAINEADEALKILKGDKASVFWATVMIDRGAAYKDRISGDHKENLREALRSADAAPTVLKPGTFIWALATNNKGVALENLQDADHSKNLQAALDCFQLALKVFDRKQYPDAWAMVMFNLGDTYSRLGDPKHARQAIAFYKGAQEVRDRRRYPREWAETMRGLSEAYMLGPSADRMADFRQAIATAQDALQIVKRDENAGLWAALSRDLANSLAAVGEHRKALAIYNALTDSAAGLFAGEDAAILLYNRGNSYSKLSGKHEREFLLDAISSYERALGYVNEQIEPDLWGKIMHNRGVAYLSLSDKGRQHIDSAIQSFDSALRVRSRDHQPQEWATTMLSRGMAFLALDTKDDAIAAADCFERSMQVFTERQYPAQWRIASRLRDKAVGGVHEKSHPKPIDPAPEN
jgi:tetratricopeptide (TPR) repeat protein